MENKEETKSSKFKVVFWLTVLAFAIFGVSSLVMWAVDWSSRHDVLIQVPWTTRAMIVITEREPEVVTVLSPIAEEVIADDIDLDNLTEEEQIIYDIWGIKRFQVARALARCETCGGTESEGRCADGIDHLAVNWESKDWGMFQINLPIWEKPIMDKFGWNRSDLLDPVKNATAALWIYDRADGVEDNDEGNYSPWVVLGGQCFTSEL